MSWSDLDLTFDLPIVHAVELSCFNTFTYIFFLLDVIFAS